VTSTSSVASPSLYGAAARRNQNKSHMSILDGVQQDLNMLSITVAEAGKLAQGRQKWRISTT